MDLKCIWRQTKRDVSKAWTCGWGLSMENTSQISGLYKLERLHCIDRVRKALKRNTSEIKSPILKVCKEDCRGFLCM